MPTDTKQLRLLMASRDIRDSGFVVGGELGKPGSYFYANIEPNGGHWYRQFLPWVRRWWFEVAEVEDEPSDELGIGVVSWAYEKGGSGGAYTLRGAVMKAQVALQELSSRQYKEYKNGKKT